jgi:hypothetical protein
MRVSGFDGGILRDANGVLLRDANGVLLRDANGVLLRDANGVLLRDANDVVLRGTKASSCAQRSGVAGSTPRAMTGLPVRPSRPAAT